MSVTKATVDRATVIIEYSNGHRVGLVIDKVSYMRLNTAASVDGPIYGEITIAFSSASMDDSDDVPAILLPPLDSQEVTFLVRDEGPGEPLIAWDGEEEG